MADRFYRYEDKTTKLLEELDKATAQKGGPDRALWCLLKRFESSLPEIDDYFHKAFRQVDVTGSGFTDTAIWHLIGASEVFWTCFAKVQAKDDAAIAAKGE